MYKLLIVLSVILVLVLGYVIHKDILTPATSNTISEHTFHEGYVLVTIGDAIVNAELALTPETRTQGLSGREKLNDDHGMLFVYKEPQVLNFWMPRMNFALDIIWLNENFVVVDITENATPESFPETFSPSIPAQFALEVSTGYAKKHGIRVGTQAHIE